MTKQKLFSVKEVAKQTGISERTIRAKIQRGDIKAQTEFNSIGQKKYLLPEPEIGLLTGKTLYIGKNNADLSATGVKAQKEAKKPLAMPEQLARAETQVELISEQLKELKEQLEDERIQKEKAQTEAGYWRGRGVELDRQVRLLTTGKDTGKSSGKTTGKVAREPVKPTGKVAKRKAKRDTGVGKTSKKGLKGKSELKTKPVKQEIKTIWQVIRDYWLKKRETRK